MNTHFHDEDIRGQITIGLKLVLLTAVVERVADDA